MPRTFFDQDIRSLSDFRANATSFIKQVHQTKRPIVITQHGNSAAVLMDIKEYETLMDQLELLQDIHMAEAQLKEGKGVPHSEAKAGVLKRLRT